MTISAIRFLTSAGLLFTVTAATLVAWASDYVQARESEWVRDGQDFSSEEKFVAGEVLVEFKPGTSALSRQHTADNLGGRVTVEPGAGSGVSRIRLADGDDVMTAVEAFRADPGVEHAQPNYIYHATAMPNDPGYSQLWGMNNTGQTVANPAYSNSNPGIAGSDIDAQLAWDHITDCSSVVVAVLDSGINYTHTDLAANMWDGSALGYPNHGYDFVDNDNDPMAEGGENHGTHVAGTVGAVGNNSLGVSGVCWQASIMSVRVLAANGGTTADIVRGIEFASDNGASVINMSLGGENPFDKMFSNAITYARNRDVVVVVAAGNGGADGETDNNDQGGDDGNNETIYQPCNFGQTNLVCVAALDQAYNLSRFSNFGETSVDVGAPGTNTLSSMAGRVISDDFSDGWNLGGAWAVGFCSPFTILSNPANYCSGGRYSNGIDHRAYKAFDLSGVRSAQLSYYAQVDTEPGFDFFSTAMRPSGGNPFAGGTILQSGSGSTGGLLSGFRHDISSCNTATCSLGFRLTSDSSGTYRGAAIVLFSIDTVEINSTEYSVFNGTSMATPHVAGIAALIRAYNPDYTWRETVAAITNGGEPVNSLAGKTASGRAANAMGAISYISVPTGLTAGAQ